MRGLKSLTRMIFSPRSTWRWVWTPRSRFNYKKQVGDGTGSSAVMAPLLWICRTFPEAPPALWKKDPEGQEEEVADHELLRLLERPNPYYSGRILWMAVLLDWVVNGDGYWLKLRNDGNAVRQLWYAPSWMMEPQGDENEFISHYDYRPDQAKEPKRLEVADVVHFRYGMDPDDARHGKSPLSSVLREVFTDDEAANFTSSLLRNMGVPGLVVAPKDKEAEPSDEEIQATKQQIMERTTGDRRGEPLVMSGPTDVHTFGFSPEQMNLRELRRIPEERVTAVLGIPAIVAGLGAGLDRSTFANYAEAREAAYEQNIIPSQGILAEDIRWQLLSDFESDPFQWRFGFDLSNVRVLQEDENKKAERFNKMLEAGAITRAEHRREFGHPVEDSDEVFYIPTSVVETPRDGAPEPDNPPPELGPDPLTQNGNSNQLTPEELAAVRDRLAGAAA